MNSCTTMIKTLCFIFLCSLTVVNSATVTINALGATTTSPTTKTYVGPLKLVDDPALGFTLDFNATFGSGDTLTGMKLQVGAKTNDNPGKYLLYIDIYIYVIELYLRKNCKFPAFHLSIVFQ